MSVPIAELSTIGAGVASRIPELNTITQTKAVGTAGKVTGKLLGNIPKKGDAVEDLLQDAASNVEDFAAGIEQKAVREFAMMSNPRTAVFTSKMNDMIRIYNHTSSISFDEKNIYLEMDMVSA